MTGEINKKKLNTIEKNYLQDKRHTVLRHALSSVSLNDALTSLDDVDARDFTFSLELPTLPVSDQKRSGRCWIFSASTILREIIAKKTNLKGQFEISQNYISYYDKLEKYNYSMEAVIRLALEGEKPDSRKVAFVLSGVSDGGQWDMYVDLVKKYGVVPKAAFPETFQSENTALSTRYLNSLLSQFASEVYKGIENGKEKEDLEALRENYLTKIYAVLTDCFGVPPKTFDFEYYDKDGKFHSERNLTPLAFYNEYLAKDIDEYVSLIHAPTKDKKYHQTYTIDLVGNVVGGKEITHLNLPFDRLEELIIAQLKDGYPVWFGSDVTYYGLRSKGVWDTSAFDYENAFDQPLAFPKEDMLDYHASAMNHAMVITGVNLVKDKPNRWKIENSWGKENGHDGYYVMSEDFFKRFVYQAAIRKEYLNDTEKKDLQKKPVVLPPWDPFGTLAD